MKPLQNPFFMMVCNFAEFSHTKVNFYTTTVSLYRLQCFPIKINFTEKKTLFHNLVNALLCVHVPGDVNVARQNVLFNQLCWQIFDIRLQQHHHICTYLVCNLNNVIGTKSSKWVKTIFHSHNHNHNQVSLISVDFSHFQSTALHMCNPKWKE